MPAQTCRITTFSRRTGESGTVTLPTTRVKALRQRLEAEGIMITSSRIVRA